MSNIMFYMCNITMLDQRQYCACSLKNRIFLVNFKLILINEITYSPKSIITPYPSPAATPSHKSKAMLMLVIFVIGYNKKQVL